jgi:hypothetical protein
MSDVNQQPDHERRPDAPTLVEWLRERLDEDEQTAKVAGRFHPPPWRLDPEVQTSMELGRWIADAQEEGVVVANGDWAAKHIARLDPARVLAEVEAKRELIDEHAEYEWAETIESEPVGQGLCRKCADWDNVDYDGPPHEPYPCDTLRLLALPYADAPGYREEWRP